MLNYYTPAQSRLPMQQQMRQMQEDLNRMIGNLRTAAPREFPAMNIWANPSGAVLTAQVPGVDPEALDIAVHQETVSLRGTRTMEDFGEGAVIHRQERPTGAFTRSFVLPFRINADAVQASFKHGMLTLNLPRPDTDQPHKIKVTRGDQS
ncbi:MAG: heat shock protein Hsp20 family [Hyphomicrobiales bacterium]|nr:heat shock protein Hsp20 family [Hyphomicrobiales bacterium]